MFRRLVEAYWQACEPWADAELTATDGGGQKKGLQQAFDAEILAEIEAFLGRARSMS